MLGVVAPPVVKEAELVDEDVRPAVHWEFVRAVTCARQRHLEDCAKADEKPSERFLVGLRLHDPRHKAISRLASIFPMHKLAEITGRKDPRMLLRYCHPKPEDLAKKLEQSTR